MSDDLPQNHDHVGAEFGLPPMPNAKGTVPAWAAAYVGGWEPPDLVNWADWQRTVAYALIALATNQDRLSGLTAEVLGLYRRQLGKAVPEAMRHEPLWLVPLAEALCGFKPFPLLRTLGVVSQSTKLWEASPAEGSVPVECLPIFVLTPMFKEIDPEKLPPDRLRIYATCPIDQITREEWRRHLREEMADHRKYAEYWNRRMARLMVAECIDLLAWHAEYPQHWFSRTGLYFDALGRWGEDLDAYVHGLGGEALPLTLHQTPKRWNDAGGLSGDGVCLLRRTAHVPDALRMASEIVIDGDKDFAADIYDWLRKPTRRRQPDVTMKKTGAAS